MAETWLRCTECKTDIPFGGKHYLCSVSTCKRSKMRLVFCSVVCWDSHLSMVRHREAWAEEAVAPSKDAWQRELAEQQAAPAPPPKPTPAPPRPAGGGPAGGGVVVGSRPAGAGDSTQPIRAMPAAAAIGAPARRVVGDGLDRPAGVAASLEGVAMSDTFDKDILIVVSKMKKYIKDRSGMNCSDAIAEALSDHVRNLCDDSIRAAARDERKTVLDRDVPRPRR